MKQYLVTRKRQVTIPKTLADKKGIKPGDSIIFEETKEGIILKRTQESTQGDEEKKLRNIAESFAADIPFIKGHLKRSRRALNENISRHINSQRH
jgi:AbrB family looped-hinge helix DNA binding protein